MTKKQQQIIDYGMVILAGILYSVALKYFVFPSRVILTGTEGIASSLSYFFDSDTLFVLLYVIFQACLLVFAYYRVSRVFAVRTLIVVSTVALCLMVLPDLSFAQPEPQNERIILVLFGGILAGVAKAFAFTYRGSTGDEDILAAYFAAKYLKPVGSIAVIAATISTSFGLILGLVKGESFESAVNTLMYTCIYIFASTETLNNIYRKFKITMLAIVTQKQDEIGKMIVSVSPHRTYTIDSSKGGRSGAQFTVIRTIITQEELPQMIAAIHDTDPNGFYYYHDIEGISGRYYITPVG